MEAIKLRQDFSKFPIISQGNVIFPDSKNNVIYADIKKGKDIE
jgi:hypothetical protein